jgi:hypothetical protein
MAIIPFQREAFAEGDEGGGEQTFLLLKCDLHLARHHVSFRSVQKYFALRKLLSILYHRLLIITILGLMVAFTLVAKLGAIESESFCILVSAQKYEDSYSLQKGWLSV